jgi:branched-chain amino acid transport system permease protein
MTVARGAIERYLRLSWTPLVLGVVIVVTYTLVEAGGDIFYQQEAERLFIRLMLVLGLHMFTGNSGVVSFGHVAFMAAGAYSSALLTIPPEVKEFTFTDMPNYLSSWIFPAELGGVAGTLAGAAVAGALAALFAIPIARLAGISAAIATVAILVIANVFISQTPSVTLGTDVITGIPQTTTLQNTMIWLLIVLGVAYGFQQSRHGLRLRATRENEDAAKSVGINVRTERYIAFWLSGVVFGVAGALYAHYFVGFSHADFYFDLTFIIIAMLVVGGMTSVTGAVVGTYLLTVVYVGVQRIEVNGLAGVEPPSGSANLMLALVLLVALVARPAGITGGHEIPWPGRRSRRGRRPGAPPAAPAPAAAMHAPRSR